MAKMKAEAIPEQQCWDEYNELNRKYENQLKQLESCSRLYVAERDALKALQKVSEDALRTAKQEVFDMQDMIDFLNHKLVVHGIIKD